MIVPIPEVIKATGCKPSNGICTECGKQVGEVEAAGSQFIHLDMMDGLFVPSISFGLPIIQSIRKCSERIFDVHLMIEEPGRYIDDFAKAGADICKKVFG